MYMYIYIYIYIFPKLHYNLIIICNTCSCPPKYFDIFRPSSGRYLTDKNTVMASYVKDVQL